VWFSRGKLIRCLAHNKPLGISHLCDPILDEIKLPTQLNNLVKMDQTVLKQSLLKIENRLQTIQKDRKQFLIGGTLQTLAEVAQSLDFFIRESPWLKPLRNKPKEGDYYFPP